MKYSCGCNIGPMQDIIRCKDHPVPPKPPAPPGLGRRIGETKVVILELKVPNT